MSPEAEDAVLVRAAQNGDVGKPGTQSSMTVNGTLTTIVPGSTYTGDVELTVS